MKEKVREGCKAVHGEDLARCMEMGRIGAEWLWKKRGGKDGKTGLKVITVCNTGSLATSVSYPAPFSTLLYRDDRSWMEG